MTPCRIVGGLGHDLAQPRIGSCRHRELQPRGEGIFGAHRVPERVDHRSDWIGPRGRFERLVERLLPHLQNVPKHRLHQRGFVRVVVEHGPPRHPRFGHDAGGTGGGVPMLDQHAYRGLQDLGLRRLTSFPLGRHGAY